MKIHVGPQNEGRGAIPIDRSLLLFPVKASNPFLLQFLESRNRYPCGYGRVQTLSGGGHLGSWKTRVLRQADHALGIVRNVDLNGLDVVPCGGYLGKQPQCWKKE